MHLEEIQVMRTRKTKSSQRMGKHFRVERNGKRESFRDLKAFGIWADRTDFTDPVAFTKRLRARMEHASDGR
jgi:hypothetical protein